MLNPSAHGTEPSERPQTFTFAGHQLVERSTWAPTVVERALLWSASVLGWPSRALTRVHSRRFDQTHPDQVQFVDDLVAAVENYRGTEVGPHLAIVRESAIEDLARGLGYRMDPAPDVA